jgi:hypothetical protein
MFNSFSRSKVPGFNVSSPEIPGFRVRPQDAVPGFNVGLDKLTDETDTSPDATTPQDAGSAPTVAPTSFGFPTSDPGGNLPLAAAPRPPWLDRLLTMPLPTASNVFDSRTGRRIVPYAPLIGYPTTEQSQFPSSDSQADVQGASTGPNDSSDSEMVEQGTGATPALPVGSGADRNFVLANANGDSVQEAQQTQPAGRVTPTIPPGPSVRAVPGGGKRPSPTLRGELSSEEMTSLTERRREEALSQDPLFEASRYAPAREERRHYWDNMLHQLPLPALPGSGIQAPLPDDWRAAVRKIGPNYLANVESAATKYGIPAELLARLVHRESSFDKNKRSGKNGAVGLPQMYPPALRDVGVNPSTFGSATAAAQIDAGAAYLAQQYRRFGDWPRAVAAYHFGFPRIGDWSAGRGPNYDKIKERTENESAGFPDAKLANREAEAKTRAIKELGQWQELQGYLPYIFLGDPNRYDGVRKP